MTIRQLSSVIFYSFLVVEQEMEAPALMTCGYSYKIRSLKQNIGELIAAMSGS